MEIVTVQLKINEQPALNCGHFTFSISEKTIGKSAVLVNNLTRTLNCMLFKVTVKPRTPWTLEIFKECLLCYDHSTQSKDQDMQRNNKRFAIPAWGLVFSLLIGFSLQHNNIPEIFFWVS